MKDNLDVFGCVFCLCVCVCVLTGGYFSILPDSRYARPTWRRGRRREEGGAGSLEDPGVPVFRVGALQVNGVSTGENQNSSITKKKTNGDALIGVPSRWIRNENKNGANDGVKPVRKKGDTNRYQ